MTAPAHPPSTGDDPGEHGTLGGTEGPLVDHHDALLLDLDGTVWLGGELIPHARTVLTALGRSGIRLLYVTNNASRSPAEIADQLAHAGLATDEADVVTSAQAAAELLAGRVPAASAILVVGSEALAAEVVERGLRPVRSTAMYAGRLKTPDPDGSDRVAAVVQGFGPDVGWRDLAAAAHAVSGGALWVASNVDPTLPTDEGLSPGNGSLVTVVATATGTRPVVAGKPERPLIDAAVRRSGAQAPLVVGDRLDTDLAAAVGAGLPGLFVLTGVSRPADLLRAPAELRPRYIAEDLRGLQCAQLAPRRDGAGWVCGSWRAEVRDGVATVAGVGSDSAGSDRSGADDSDLDGLRALAEAVWEYTDREHAVPDGLDDALAALGLPETARSGGH